MKRLLLAALLFSCRANPEQGDPYWKALQASVTDETAYGRERLLHYREWQSLPEDRGGLDIPAELDRSALLALGKEAFHRSAPSRRESRICGRCGSSAICSGRAR
jgi:hypothetical protein